MHTLKCETGLKIGFNSAFHFCMSQTRGWNSEITDGIRGPDSIKFSRPDSQLLRLCELYEIKLIIISCKPVISE